MEAWGQEGRRETLPVTSSKTSMPTNGTVVRGWCWERTRGNTSEVWARSSAMSWARTGIVQGPRGVVSVSRDTMGLTVASQVGAVE